MKLQNLSVIFIIIILPIVFIISLAFTSQIETINKKIEYNKKVLGAATDAIKAFEINTSHEEFSEVPDVLRSIVEASVNTFKDSLATKLNLSGATKDQINTYFPMGVFTLYDGYYIASSSKEPLVLRNDKGNAVHVDDEGVTYINDDNLLYEKPKSTASLDPAEAMKKTENNNLYKPVLFEKEGEPNKYTTLVQHAKKDIKTVLKNFNPYAAKYKFGDMTIYINYTLDNYLTIQGQKGNGDSSVFFSKSGYILNKDTKATLDVATSNPALLPKNLGFLNDPEQGNDDVIDAYIDDLRAKKVKMTLNVENGYVNDYKIVKEDPNFRRDLRTNFQIVYEPSYETTLKKPVFDINHTGGEKLEYEKQLADYNASNAYADQQIAAIKYYLKAQRFSKWVYANLGNLELKDIIQDQPDKLYQQYKNQYSVEVFKDIKKEGNVKIFDGDVEDYASNFYQHKKDVMKNIILHSCFTAAVNYNESSSGHGDFRLPILDDEDFEKMINKISFTAFCHDLGNQGSNTVNYAIVSSTENEFNTQIPNLVFVKKDQYNKGNDEKKGEINYYYGIYSDIFKDPSKNEQLIVLRKSQFENDGKYNRYVDSYIFSNKNYADISTILPDTANIKEYGKLNQFQKSTVLTGQASLKQQMYKLTSNPSDSTVFFYKPDKEFDGGSNTLTVPLPPGLIGPNRTIKGLTFTLSTNLNIPNDTRIELKQALLSYVYPIKVTIGDAQYQFNVPVKDINSKSVFKVDNGLKSLDTKEVSSVGFKTNPEFKVEVGNLTDIASRTFYLTPEDKEIIDNLVKQVKLKIDEIKIETY